jgi:hypothetical protein
MRPLASAILGLVFSLPVLLPAAAMSADTPATANSAEPASTERALKIVNNTRSLLTELYTSPVDAAAWGADQLGNMRIAAGGNVTVNLRSGEGACLFDVMMVFSDGEKVVRRENVCGSGTLIVTEHQDDPLPAA